MKPVIALIILLAFTAAMVLLSSCKPVECVTGTLHQFGKWKPMIENGKPIHNLEGTPMLTRECDVCGYSEYTPFKAR